MYSKSIIFRPPFSLGPIIVDFLIFAGLASHGNLNVNLFTSWAKFSGMGRTEALKMALISQESVLIMSIFPYRVDFLLLQLLRIFQDSLVLRKN